MSFQIMPSFDELRTRTHKGFAHSDDVSEGSTRFKVDHKYGVKGSVGIEIR
jgi:hypothetical protein